MFSSVGYSATADEVVADYAIACDLAGHNELERKGAIARIIRNGEGKEEYFISMLRSPKTIQRQIAAEILGGMGGEKSEPALIAALTDKDVFLQGAAARALAVLYSRLPQASLASTLQENTTDMVRMAVLYGMYKTHSISA